MRERWVDINGFPNYQISNLGRVKLKEHTLTVVGDRKTHDRVMREKILKPQINKKNGYVQIMIGNKGEKRKLLYIHRLVAEAFLKPNDEIKTVTHKDGDKLNNMVSNLAYERPVTNKRFKNVNREKYNYIIKQKLQNNACIAVYNGFDELIKKGYRKESILHLKNESVYKGYKWEVIRNKKEENNND